MKKFSIICLVGVLISALFVGGANAASSSLLPDEWSVSAEKDCCYLSTDAHSGKYSLTAGYNSAFDCSVYQDLTGLPNGKYTVKGYSKSDGGQETCWVSVKNHGSGEQRAAIEPSDKWREFSATVEVTTGRALISFYNVTKDKAWAMIDDVTFTDENGKDYIKNGNFETVSETAVAAGGEPDRAVPGKAASYDFYKWTLYTNASNEVAFMINGGHSGKYCGVHYGIVPYTASTFQELSGLPKGTYNVEVYVKSSGGQNSAVLSVTGDGKKTNQALPVTDEWTKVVVKGVKVNKGVLDYSVYSDSPGGCFIKYDDFNVYEQSNPAKNLAMNGGFEVFDVRREGEDDGTGTGEMGAAGDTEIKEEISGDDETGMQQNEEEEMDFGGAGLETKTGTNLNVLFIIGLAVIILCGLASVSLLVVLLLQGRKKKISEKET